MLCKKDFIWQLLYFTNHHWGIQVMSKSSHGFTLIELLVVVAIIAILAAILFPVFVTARLYSKSAGCLSNLRQLASAIHIYQEQWDDQFPYGLDPADYYANVFANYNSPNFSDEQNKAVRDAAKALQDRPDRGGMLDQVLKPYTQTTEVWHCPADTGVGFLNLPSWPQKFDSGNTSSYEMYHMSYGYRTELALLHIKINMLKFPAQIQVLSDGAGYWHARYSRAARKTGDTDDSTNWHYNTLFADGHCKSINQQTMDDSWNIPIN
jgi:general secretion pathway protein G